MVLVLRLCPCDSSKAAQHLILVITNTVLLFGDPPLPCLFTVEVTKKNLATCPKRIKRHVSKCSVKLKCMYLLNLNSQFVHLRNFPNKEFTKVMLTNSLSPQECWELKCFQCTFSTSQLNIFEEIARYKFKFIKIY